MQFKFDLAQFNRLFPFFLLTGENLQIISAGKSLTKICEATPPKLFNDLFKLERPDIIVKSFTDFDNLKSQLVILETKSPEKILLRGQFDYLESERCYLFIGTPWFGSMDEIRHFGLTLDDFALHDPMIDLLHVVKSQEIISEESRKLLQTVNEQQGQLKESEEKYRSIVEKATHIIYKISANGFFTYVNRVAERITGYTREELLNMHYLKLIRSDYISKAYEFYLNQVQNKIPTTYFEFPVVTKSNEQVWIGQSVQCHKNKNNEIELTALAIDITQKKKAERNLAKQEEKYRNIIANMKLGLIEKDLKHNIIYVNQSFCDLTGYTFNEVIGKSLVDFLFDPSDTEAISNQFKKREKGISDTYTARIKTKTGESRWWMISGAPQYNDKGEMIGAVGIQLDITNQKRLEEELKSAKEKAEASSKAKEIFLATMSHEIRTPLNAIVGITDLMHLNPEVRSKEQLDVLNFSAKNLLALITDILDVSKIDAGKLEIAKNAIDIEQVVNGIYQMFRSAFEEKKVKLILNIDDSIPKTVIGDELRLSQILNNLISNSLKFTHIGSVAINVTGNHTPIGKIRLLFEIRDTGIGIKKANLEKIFKAFEQADQRISRQFGGTGLGLNITKKLVELQGGEIRVESKLNQGSVFCFYIDYEVMSQHDARNETKAPGNMKIYTVGNDKTVLVVEDNIVNQKVAASYINHWGLKCGVANNGAEALNILTKGHYDIALIDLYMPVMDGFETIRRIRKNKLFKNMPIIALTASAETNLMKKAIASGANRCLTKPFNSQELYTSIIELSNISRPELSVNKKTTMNKNNTTKFKFIDLKKLEEASLGSKQFMVEMLDIIGSQVPELLKEADSLWAQGNYEVFWKAIHKTKNNMLQIGMDKLSKDLNFIEKHSQRKTKLNEVEMAFARVKAAWNKAQMEIEEAKISFSRLQLAS